MATVKSTSSKTTKTYSQPDYKDPTYVNFDSNAWKNAYIDSMVSELQKNYDTDQAALDKTYNTNITNYNNQIADTNMSYDANIQNLQKQRYQDYQEAKNSSFARGLGNGGLGAAIEQTAINNANNKIAETQNERTKAINNINTLINQAAYNYGVDSDTLLKNFNSDKLKYMSTAELQALEKQLEVDTYNNDWTNQFAQDYNNRTFTSSENALAREFEASEAQKNRDAQTALAKLQAKLYGSRSSGGSGRYGSSGSYGSGNSSGTSKDVLAANYLQSAGISANNAKAKKLYWDYIDGSISWNEFRNGVDKLVSGGSSSGSKLEGLTKVDKIKNPITIGKLLGDTGFNLSHIRTGYSGVSGKTGASGATDGHTKRKGGHR